MMKFSGLQYALTSSLMLYFTDCNEWTAVWLIIGLIGIPKIFCKNPCIGCTTLKGLTEVISWVFVLGSTYWNLSPCLNWCQTSLVKILAFDVRFMYLQCDTIKISQVKRVYKMTLVRWSLLFIFSQSYHLAVSLVTGSR